MINHVEKLIFGIGVVAVFGLLYVGMSTKKYSKSDPEKLSKDQASAERYIAEPDAWQKIESLRVAQTDAPGTIRDNQDKVVHSEYQYGHFMNTRLRTLGLRMDPELKPAQSLTATVITAPIVIQEPHDRFFNDFLTSLDSGYVAPKDDEEDDKKDDEGDGLGGVGAGGGTGGDFERQGKKDDETVDTGPAKLPETQKLEMPLNPVEQLWVGRGSKGKRPEIRECICVTGLVPYESQWKEFDAKLRDAKGWFPLRDRPRYVYLEIQRRADGGEWVDLTKTLNGFNKDVYAQYKSMLVPEFVEKKYLHPVLTHQIPPVLNMDYRQISSHPKVGFKTFFEQKKKDDSKDEKDTDASDPFAVKRKKDGDKKDDDKKDGKSGDLVKKDKKGIPPRGDDDPTITGGGSTQLGGIGGQTGISMQEINEELLQELPSSEYKLVRFFDPTVKSGVTYEYRVRVWLTDPNNPDKSVVSKAKSGGGMNAPSAGGGMAAPSAGGGGSGAGAATGGDFEKSDGAGGGSMDRDDTQKSGPGLADIQYRPLSPADLDPVVRDRVRAWEDKVAKDASVIPDPEMETLKHARPTAWSEPTEPVKVYQAPAKFYAGGATRRGAEEFASVRYYTADPFVEMIVAKQDRELDVEIPAERRVYAGDVMNFRTDTRFVHPIDWTIHERRNLVVDSDAVVVGISGGERLSFTVARMEENERTKKVRPIFTREKTQYIAPAEVLIMDGAGNFQVRNEMEDRMGYRHGKFARDVELVGAPKIKEDDEDDEEDDEDNGRRGRRGGGGGSDF